MVQYTKYVPRSFIFENLKIYVVIAYKTHISTID